MACLTNDVMIVALIKRHGITHLATNDDDFDQGAGDHGLEAATVSMDVRSGTARRATMPCGESSRSAWAWDELQEQLANDGD